MQSNNDWMSTWAAWAFVLFFFGGGLLALAVQWLVVFAVLGAVGAPFALIGWGWKKLTGRAGASSPGGV